MQQCLLSFEILNSSVFSFFFKHNTPIFVFHRIGKTLNRLGRLFIIHIAESRYVIDSVIGCVKNIAGSFSSGSDCRQIQFVRRSRKAFSYYVAWYNKEATHGGYRAFLYEVAS